jgi:hypothetical protein
LNKNDDRRDEAARPGAPEQVVVVDPPPEPDYPRYRVEPGKRASLATIDPDETEHYRKKKHDISKVEQKERLQSRLDDPDKRWKFSSSDIKERAFWDAYQQAFEDALSNCSTEHAPWYVVPVLTDRPEVCDASPSPPALYRVRHEASYPLTGVFGSSPERTATMFSAARTAILSRVSMEALPMCGARTAFSSSSSFGFTSGSFS